jgi:hypothetical protein
MNKDQQSRKLQGHRQGVQRNSGRIKWRNTDGYTRMGPERLGIMGECTERTALGMKFTDPLAGGRKRGQSR